MGIDIRLEKYDVHTHLVASSDQTARLGPGFRAPGPMALGPGPWGPGPRALVVSPGPLWAGLLWARLGPCGLPWVFHFETRHISRKDINKVLCDKCPGASQAIQYENLVCFIH